MNVMVFNASLISCIFHLILKLLSAFCNKNDIFFEEKANKSNRKTQKRVSSGLTHTVNTVPESSMFVHEHAPFPDTVMLYLFGFVPCGMLSQSLYAS